MRTHTTPDPLSPVLLDGPLAPVAVVAARRTGHRPSPATVWRWIRRGVAGGITLDAVHHGGRWLTTEDAFDQFIIAQTAAALTPRDAESPDTPGDDDLRAAGLL